MAKIKRGCKSKPKLQSGVDNKAMTREELLSYMHDKYGKGDIHIYPKVDDVTAPITVETYTNGIRRMDVKSTTEIMKNKHKSAMTDAIGLPPIPKPVPPAPVKPVPKLKKGLAGVPMAGIGDFAGSAIELMDPQKEGYKSVGASTATAAGSGAAMGMAVGGPIGAAIGGVAGGLVGGISASQANKAQKALETENARKEQITRTLSTVKTPMNTQAPMYQEGTPGASMTQPVEVEKDELVLRKDNKGQYKVVADFKGGKSHSQGGEDFVITEGDVVFPGKKRKTIMNHLKNNNIPGIESERARLPKELPGTGKLQDGIRGVPKYPTSTGDVFGVTELMTPEQRRLETLRFRSEGGTPASMSNTVPSGILPSTLKGTPDWLQGSAPESVLGTTSASVPKTTQTSSGSKGSVQASAPKTNAVTSNYVNEEVPLASWMLNEDFSDTPNEEVGMPQPLKAGSTETTTGNEASPIPTESGANWREGMRYLPAAANMLKGMQKPTKTQRNYFTPETHRYRDTSETLRQEAELQSRIDADNAVRFSGGSAQVARAGKSMSGSSRLRNLQNINAQEANRAQGIEAQNIATRNQARATNLDLTQRYNDMDMANKAAIDSYFDQGMHDFGRIGTQIRQDKRMGKVQDIALGLLGTDDFDYDKASNKIKHIKK